MRQYGKVTQPYRKEGSMKNITESRVLGLSRFLILPLFSLRKREKPALYLFTSSLLMRDLSWNAMVKKFLN